MSQIALQTGRPYIVIPKLVEQPTWGGSYIAGIKQWGTQERLANRRLGQSYELFSGSNLSLINSSADPLFRGELTDRDAVEKATTPAHSISLAALIDADPEMVLGKQVATRTNGALTVLVKLTQAMGNSFQIHLKDGSTHPFWRPKPESWYYLEPGLITLGAKPGVDWKAYRTALAAISGQIDNLKDDVRCGSVSREAAQEKINTVIGQYKPWDYVNTVSVERGQLVDLSAGGLHHSWEEDAQKLPLGNVLYELQLEALDHNSTIRGFDKGNMAKDGSVRKLNIDDYFELVDRSPETNDPATHMKASKILAITGAYTFEKLLGTTYYSLFKLTFTGRTDVYTERIEDYRHVFVRRGAAEVSTAAGTVVVSMGHSCFVPAATGEYYIQNLADKTEILITTQGA